MCISDDLFSILTYILNENAAIIYSEDFNHTVREDSFEVMAFSPLGWISSEICIS